MTDELNPAGNAVTGNFTLQCQMPNGKSFNISGYIYDQESVESLNGRVDILHDVMDRQRTRSEIPELEAKRDQMVRQMIQMREVMAELEAKQSEGKKLSSQEKLTLQNMAVSLTKVSSEVDKGGVEIEEARKKVGM